MRMVEMQLETREVCSHIKSVHYLEVNKWQHMDPSFLIMFNMVVQHLE
jgi:hypothetical protein